MERNKMNTVPFSQKSWTKSCAYTPFFIIFIGLIFRNPAQASDSIAPRVFQQSETYYQQGQFFSSARVAFNAIEQLTDTSHKARAYYAVTRGLVAAGMDQSALYFFLRTLTFRNREVTRAVLELTPLFVERVGPDLIKKSLIKLTSPQDYSTKSRSALWVTLAKDRLFRNDYPGAIQAASQVTSESAYYPLALQIRGVSYALSGQKNNALSDFRRCSERSSQRTKDMAFGSLGPKYEGIYKDAAVDLKARCLADQARVLYEMGNFDEADKVYDRIPKASFVWTDTLFEHAWATFARGEYNRTLGKLVSYRSPSLSFVFNSEIEVLNAQTYMSMCYYDDAEREMDIFLKSYGGLAQEIKTWIEKNSANKDGARDNTAQFFSEGRAALYAPLLNMSPKTRFLSRFARSPYFQILSAGQERVAAEKAAIDRIDRESPGFTTGTTEGFPAFLYRILDWRQKSIQEIGGIFIKNSAIDYYQVLIQDFEKIQFMKIDLLGKKKRSVTSDDALITAGIAEKNYLPRRRDHQVLWGFNGEFWNDELGDYVFTLPSLCVTPDSSRTPLHGKSAFEVPGT